MNLKIPSDKWMNVPSSTTLDSVANMPDSILLHDEINPIPTSALTKITKKIPPVYQLLFLEDLEKSHFPGWTFAWDHPWECQWNQLLAKFIIKHWKNANCAGPSRLFTWILLNLPIMYSYWVSYTNGLLDKRLASAWAISLQHAELPRRSPRSNPNPNYKLGVIPLSHIAWSKSHQTSYPASKTLTSHTFPAPNHSG
jgi:hypothetical protein